MMRNAPGDFRAQAQYKKTLQSSYEDLEISNTFWLKSCDIFIDHVSHHLTFLGAGSFNAVYQFEDEQNKKWVCRFLINDKPDELAEYPDLATLPERNERLLNKLNSFCETEKARALLIAHESNIYPCVVMPFIDGYGDDVKKTCDAIINLYLTERRILIDGYASNNVLITDEKIFYPDTSFAVLLKENDDIEDLFEKSQTSLEFWEVMESEYDETFGRNIARGKDFQKKTTTVIEALLTIEYCGLYKFAHKMDLHNDNSSWLNIFFEIYQEMRRNGGRQVAFQNPDFCNFCQEKLGEYAQHVSFLNVESSVTKVMTSAPSVEGLFSPTSVNANGVTPSDRGCDSSDNPSPIGRVDVKTPVANNGSALFQSVGAQQFLPSSFAKNNYPTSASPF